MRKAKQAKLSEQEVAVNQTVEEKVESIDENKTITVNEHNEKQTDGEKGLVKANGTVEKVSVRKAIDRLKADGYLSVKDIKDKSYSACPKVLEMVGEIDDSNPKFDCHYVEIKDEYLKDKENNSLSIDETRFLSEAFVKEANYRGLLMNMDDPSIFRVGAIHHCPSLQELEKWGLLVNYDRFNELMDKGVIDPTVENLLTIPPEVLKEIQERKEQNYPAAMQRYGDEIHITGKESSLELQDIGIIVDHSAIVEATKENEEEYNKNLEKLTKTKLLN